MDNGQVSEKRAALPLMVLAGFSATWAVNFALAYTFVFTPSPFLDPFQVNVSRVLYLLLIALAQGIITIASRHLIGKPFRAPLAVIATAVLLVAVFSYFPASSTGAGWAYALLLPLAGIWWGVTHVLWTEILMHFDRDAGYRTVYGSVTVGALAFIAVMTLAGSLAAPIMAGFSIIACALYVLSERRFDSASLGTAMMSRKLAKGLRKSTIALVIYGAVFGACIYACLSPDIGASSAEFAAIGAAICCGSGALLVANVFAEKTFGLNEVVSALSPVLAIVLLAQIYMGAGASWVVYPLLLCVLTAFDSTAFCFQLRVTRELDLCPLFCIARGRFLIQSGMFLAALAYLLMALLTSDVARDGTLIPLVLVGFLFVAMSTTTRVDFIPRPLVDRPLPPIEGVEAGSGAPAENGADLGAPAQPVDIEARIAEDYDLSARELDILRLLVSGYTMAGVAEKLVISQNTVKSHYYHMYRKLGVNSKKEVINIRDQYRERYKAS